MTRTQIALTAVFLTLLQAGCVSTSSQKAQEEGLIEQTVSHINTGGQKMELLEIEVFTEDPKASRKFYQEIIGLKLHEGPSNDGLNIFDVGLPRVDFNTSVHGSKGDGIGISFIVDDIAPFIARFRSHKLAFSGPEIDHTGMPSISVRDPDGNTVILHGKKPMPGLK